jgi:hypothetical protein
MVKNLTFKKFREKDNQLQNQNVFLGPQEHGEMLRQPKFLNGISKIHPLEISQQTWEE